MRILISNDDGIDAIGIKALAKVVSKNHEVLIVAPESERSASSHSLSLRYSLTYKDETEKYGYPAYSCSGTPADCVKLAILHLAKNPFDLVLSGINVGLNLGSDVIYSGTVSAAFEGVYMGVPSIAVSTSHKSSTEKYNEIADFVNRNINKLLDLRLPKTSALSINYPRNNIKGVKIAQLGINLYDDSFQEAENGLLLRGSPLPHEEADNDIYWYNNDYVVISPIQNDRNDYLTLKRISGDFK